MKRRSAATRSIRTPPVTPSCAKRSRPRSTSFTASRIASEVISTVGGSMAIYAAIRALVGRGDNAVIVSPAYAIFSNGVIMAGGEPQRAPLARDGKRFCLDLDRVAATIDRKTRLLIVNSPSNPTGWMITVEEQQALAELAERHDLVILADEVYERLVYDDTQVAPSFARVIDNKDRLIVINSFSKTYNMTGWRLGWAQSGEATIKTMSQAVEFMTSNAGDRTGRRAGSRFRQ